LKPSVDLSDDRIVAQIGHALTPRLVQQIVTGDQSSAPLGFLFPLADQNPLHAIAGDMPGL
jgi:hypothetical protein